MLPHALDKVLELSKLAQLVSEAQVAAKLQLVKGVVIDFYRISGHSPSFAKHNFTALC